MSLLQSKANAQSNPINGHIELTKSSHTVDLHGIINTNKEKVVVTGNVGNYYVWQRSCDLFNWGGACSPADKS